MTPSRPGAICPRCADAPLPSGHLRGQEPSLISTHQLRGAPATGLRPEAAQQDRARPLPRLRALDGLRGVAVAAVVVYHLSPSALPGGFLGVDVFFVLSGFLITSIVVDEVATTGRLDLRAFYLRRARRLAPALLLLIAGVSLYGATWATAGELDRLREHSLWALGYLANWKLIFDGTTYTDIVAGASPLRHTWSLAIEEQFYVVFPAVVLALVALGRHVGRPHALRRRLFGIASVGTAASALTMVSLWGDGSNPSRGYFGTDARAQSLLVGVALGAVLVGRPPVTGRAARLATCAGAAGAAVLAVAMTVADESAWWLQHGGFLLVALAAGGVISALQCAPWLRRPLSARPLVGLGLISYGVYLWHWAVIVVIDEARTGIDGLGLAAVRLGLTLGLSLASYWLVEQPIRHGTLGARLGRAAAPAVALAVSLLVVGVVASTGSSSLDGSTGLVAPAAAGEPATGGSGPGPAVGEPPDTVEGTATVPGETPSDSGTDPGDAEAPSASARQLPIPVVLLGDSVAHTLAGGVVGAFPEFVPWAPEQSPFDPASVQLWSVAKPACSFLPGRVVVDGLSAADLSQFCGDWRTDLAAALAARPRAVVVVALTNDVFDRRVDGESIALGTAAHDRLLNAFLDEVRATAVAHGGDVALLALPPRVGGLPGDDREALLRAAYERFAADRPGVRVLDLSEEICPEGDCGRPPTGYDPAWRYDGLHFSTSGAEWAARWITRALLRG